jgi:hypothetical protein
VRRGPALTTVPHTHSSRVIGMEKFQAWTGSWTGSPGNASAVSAICAISRAIGAASASRAWDHVPRNASVSLLRRTGSSMRVAWREA